MTLSEIYTAHKQTVYFHVLSVVKNVHDAEEITNDVFIKMYKYESAMFNEHNEKGAKIESWLRTVANSVIFDHFRKVKKLKNNVNVDGYVNEDGKSNFDFIAPTSTNADKNILNSEVQTKIKKAFDSLDEKYIDIANFYFIHEYKYSEIATMLNIPEGTVKGMLNRARTKLQESLKSSQMA
jgi:RNA polymerase sigma-70 factor (ECF subfamily)